MPQFERGVYEPSDEVRVFDGSEEDDDVEGSRLPLLIVLALLVLAMFGGLVWLAYTQGVARGRSETPVLTAAAGPVRTAPQTGGGDQTYKGFKIYEQPAPPDEEGDTVAPPPAPDKPVAQAAPVAEPAPVEAPKPAPAVAAAPPKPAPVVAAPKPAPVVAAAPPKPAPPKPAAAPAIKSTVLPPPSAVATGAPRPLVAATPPPVAAKPAPGGAYVLQIGAYKSQADADAAWKTYKSRHAALLSGYGPNVQQADLGEKGTWYRLRVSGFSDRDVALALCDRLKADGGACILGK